MYYDAPAEFGGYHPERQDSGATIGRTFSGNTGSSGRFGAEDITAADLEGLPDLENEAPDDATAQQYVDDLNRARERARERMQAQRQAERVSSTGDSQPGPSPAESQPSVVSDNPYADPARWAIVPDVPPSTTPTTPSYQPPSTVPDDEDQFDTAIDDHYGLPPRRPRPRPSWQTLRDIPEDASLPDTTPRATPTTTPSISRNPTPAGLDSVFEHESGGLDDGMPAYNPRTHTTGEYLDQVVMPWFRQQKGEPETSSSTQTRKPPEFEWPIYGESTRRVLDEIAREQKTPKYRIKQKWKKGTSRIKDAWNKFLHDSDSD
jgi:hypothetical protein